MPSAIVFLRPLGLRLARVKTGKKIELFDKPQQEEAMRTRITKEQKEQELAYLFDKFGE